ncbi:hypothetical protein ACFL2T_05475, partial [Elusimicrobiota bacterium]
GQIVDSVPSPQGHYASKSVRDTDLCKKFLNALGVGRRTVPGVTAVKPAASEFATFIEKYGVAHTVFQAMAPGTRERTVLAKSNHGVAGIEFGSSRFFLPFHTRKRSPDVALDVARLVIRAILDYRQKRQALVPEWVDIFKFKEEEVLLSAFDALLQKAHAVHEQIQRFRSHKAILTTSGEILREKTIAILQSFFEFKVDPIDQGREDGKILGDDGSVLCLFEVKGTKKGVSRENINQTDSHRERNDLNPSTPAVLFINNQMHVADIQKRLAAGVADEHVKHAARGNITIVRTVDLLFLMKHLEEKAATRTTDFLALVSSGGGWLKAGPEGYELVR